MKKLTLLILICVYQLVTSATVFSAEYDNWVTLRATSTFIHATGKQTSTLSAGRVFYGAWDNDSKSVLCKINNTVYRVSSRTIVSFSEITRAVSEVNRLQAIAEQAAAEAKRYEQLAAAQAPRYTDGTTTFNGYGSTTSSGGGYYTHNFNGTGTYSDTSTGADYYRYTGLMNSYIKQANECYNRIDLLVRKYKTPNEIMQNFLSK
jgi:hypothetical protein